MTDEQRETAEEVFFLAYHMGWNLDKAAKLPKADRIKLIGLFLKEKEKRG